MIKIKREDFKVSLITFFGRLFQFILMFLAIKISTTILGPEEYGKYGIAMGFIAFISYIFIGPIGLMMNRNLNNWKNEGNLKKVLNIYFFYLIIISAIGGLFGSFYLEAIKFKRLLEFYCIFSYLLFFTVSYTLIPSLNIFGSMKLFYFYLNLNLFFGIFLGYLLVENFGSEYQYWLLGISTGNMITAVLSYFTIKKSYFKVEKIRGFLNFKSNINFSIGILLSSIFLWAHLMGYRFIAEETVGYAILGQYMAEATIALGIISAYEQITTGILHPIFYKSADHDNSAWKIYAEKMIISSIPVCFFIIGSSDFLGSIVLGEQYQGNYLFLKLCAVSETIRVLISTLSFKFHQNLKTFNMIVPSGFLALGTNITIFFYITSYGIIITPVAMIIFGSIVSLIYMFVIGNETIVIIKSAAPSLIFCLIFYYFLDLGIKFFANEGFVKYLQFFLFSMSMGLLYIIALRGRSIIYILRKA